MSEKLMEVNQIRIDGGTQARAELNQDTITEYAEAIKAGARFPALVAFFDGKAFWLAEGFHRWHALRAAGKKLHMVNVHQGSQEDAQWFACAANATHGLKRSRADMKEAVRIALAHPKGKASSLRELAAYIKISHEMVRILKEELSTVDSKPDNSKENSTSEPENASFNTPPASTETAPAAPPAPPEEPKDAVGQVIPQKLRPLFDRRQEINALLTQLSTIKGTVLKSIEDKDALYWHLNVTHFQSSITNARTALAQCLPYALCPYCKGRGCKVCGTHGVVCKFAYEAAPREMQVKKP